MEVPRGIRLTGLDEVTLREGGGCLVVFGLPFLAAGLFVSSFALGVLPVSNADEVTGWTRWLMLLMGVVFVAAGAGMVLGRSYVAIDRGRGRVFVRKTLLVPIRSEEYSLGFYREIGLRMIQGDSDSATRYPVVLVASAGQPDLAVCSPTAYGSAWAQASYLADFLRLPLVDASTAHEVRLQADQAARPLGEREGATAEAAGIERPAQMVSQVEEVAGRLRVFIPAPKLGWAALLPIALPIAVLLFVGPALLAFMLASGTPLPVRLFFLGWAAFLLLVLPLLHLLTAVLRARRGGVVISASGDGIDIETIGAWRSRTRRIPADDLVDLDYATGAGVTAAVLQRARASMKETPEAWRQLRPGMPQPTWLRVLRYFTRSQGIMVKSRSGVFNFGAGLPDDELTWLHAALHAALAGAPLSPGGSGRPLSRL